jgi:carbon-monoxide dehydrogenase medium subunit
MKPAPFEYAAPTNLGEALALLAGGGPDARPLAGGQSLVPAMAFRLARPSLLVDLNRISALRGLHAANDGGVIAGAMTRHRDFETSPLIKERLPLVHAAMRQVSHLPIRSRGTIGGSLAHADPAGDWPALCLVCDAELTLVSSGGTRKLPTANFLQGVYATALAQGEIVSEVRFPAWPRGRRWGTQKMARRLGDFAIVGVACIVDVDAQGRCVSSRIVVHGAADRALEVPAASQEIAGKRPDTNGLRAAAHAAATSIPTRGDLHADAAYRTELIEALTYRALEQAFDG